ncbi:MAG: amidase [Spirochaetales bacterium]|jgi:aspartyl-tRNA(Asn)/glutamyl-tRNA(Gln) amidotransferase subunit A
MGAKREQPAVAESLADYSAIQLLNGFRAGSFSPIDAMKAVLARIEAREPIVRALWGFDPETATRKAEESAKRWRQGKPKGRLDGVPLTLKENIPTKGLPLPLGCAATELVPAVEDGPPAARLAEAGAILISKTTMPDLGMLSSGLSSFHALTTNPWNPAWNPGGSSAGAGAAAAAGYGPLHMGSDIGGSLRLPASWNAIVTLKPSAGRVPIDPPYFGRVAGPMTRTAADAALMMSVVSKPDARDYMSLPPSRIRWNALSGFDPKGLRIGYLPSAGCGLPVDPATALAIRKAAELFERAGARVERMDPFFSAEMLHDLDLFWRVRAWADYLTMKPERRKLVLPFIREWLEGGSEVTGTEMMRCVNRQLEVKKITQAATRPFDFVLSPVSPVPTYPAEWPMPSNDVTRAMDHIAFTVPYNMSDQPAASVNAGFGPDGKAIGLQIAGPRFSDLAVLRAVAWFEEARPREAVPDWSVPGKGLWKGASPNAKPGR